MDPIRLKLTAKERACVSALRCENAALEICKIYLRRDDPKVEFIAPGEGADLRIRFQDGREMDIEVKGTKTQGIGWSQLKVSSRQSYDRLKSGMPLYRVSGIESQIVTIFIMKHGVHYRMKPEARWSVHAVKKR